ncbi:MAG: hypothetical protein IAI48_15025 [Candidatus Eremiobacteraeota bacterium]|nr:hypothetical protein [Candidatus Eremiobacteraeota bacterium]
MFGAIFLIVGVVVVFGIAVITVTDRAAAASLIATVASAVSCSSTGTSSCFNATNTSSGVAVYGTSSSGTGLRGLSTSNNGLKATSTSGIGVNGQSSSNDGVYGQSGSGEAGVVGTMTSGAGVYGYTTNSSQGIGQGVLGSSNGGTGVYGVSSGGIGVFGYTSATDSSGVVGETAGGGTGVVASSVSGIGIDASSGGIAGSFSSDGNSNGSTTGGVSGEALYAYGKYVGVDSNVPYDNSDYAYFANGLNAQGQPTPVFSVSGQGDLQYGGMLTTRAPMQDGSSATAFGMKATAPTMEDTGTAQLNGGASAVRLDPTFAATIDTSRPYRVFLTPGGDSRGLYVASKSSEGFVVREAQGGRSSMTFDYRVVAAPLGHARDRMARVTRDTPGLVPHVPAAATFRRAVVRPRPPAPRHSPP